MLHYKMINQVARLWAETARATIPAPWTVRPSDMSRTSVRGTPSKLLFTSNVDTERVMAGANEGRCMEHGNCASKYASTMHKILHTSISGHQHHDQDMVGFFELSGLVNCIDLYNESSAP